MTDLTADETQLVGLATKARANAYAPYSKFKVGAAILTAQGETFSGCNVENASYGLTICAERNAACSAVAAGQNEFVLLALVIQGGHTPCGACRQFLAEFGATMPVIVVDADGKIPVRRFTISELLPSQFEFDGPDHNS